MLQHTHQLTQTLLSKLCFCLQPNDVLDIQRWIFYLHCGFSKLMLLTVLMFKNWNYLKMSSWWALNATFWLSYMFRSSFYELNHMVLPNLMLNTIPMICKSKYVYFALLLSRTKILGRIGAFFLLVEVAFLSYMWPWNS